MARNPEARIQNKEGGTFSYTDAEKAKIKKENEGNYIGKEELSEVFKELKGEETEKMVAELRRREAVAAEIKAKRERAEEIEQQMLRKDILERDGITGISKEGKPEEASDSSKVTRGTDFTPKRKASGQEGRQ